MLICLQNQSSSIVNTFVFITFVIVTLMPLLLFQKFLILPLWKKLEIPVEGWGIKDQKMKRNVESFMGISRHS